MWARLDDGYLDHPKIVQASRDALGLHTASIVYCAQQLTDGFVAAGIVPLLAAKAKVPPEGVAAAVADLLTAPPGYTAGLWEPAPGGYAVHDFLTYNPSKAKVLAEREAGKARSEMRADPGMTDRIKARDQSRCRYCGAGVRWTDRKGPRGGTYDQVIPGAGAYEDNVVVSCRACQIKKGGRSPQDAGMALRPVGLSLALDPPDPLSGPGLSKSDPVIIQSPVPVPGLDVASTSAAISHAAGSNGALAGAPHTLDALGSLGDLRALGDLDASDAGLDDLLAEDGADALGAIGAAALTVIGSPAEIGAIREAGLTPWWNAFDLIFDTQGVKLAGRARGRRLQACGECRQNGYPAEGLIVAASNWPKVMGKATMTETGLANNFHLLTHGPQVNGALDRAEAKTARTSGRRDPAGAAARAAQRIKAEARAAEIEGAEGARRGR